MEFVCGGVVLSPFLKGEDNVVDGSEDFKKLLEFHYHLFHTAILKQSLALALFPLSASQPLRQPHCVSVEPPLLSDPLTGSETDEHPGDGEDDCSGEEEDAQQVRHLLLLVVVAVVDVRINQWQCISPVKIRRVFIWSDRRSATF